MLFDQLAREARPPVARTEAVAGFIDLFRPAATDIYGANEGRGAARDRSAAAARRLRAAKNSWPAPANP